MSTCCSRKSGHGRVDVFTDMDGIPLAFCINPGNTAETTTLKPLEDKLREKFGLSKVVVCTDGGLASYENRLNDHVGERSFITVQSLKKLEGHLQDWATKTDFEARPVFLRRDDRITAHFLTCFLALILYKYLAKKVNRAGKHFSPDTQIVSKQMMKKIITSTKNTEKQ